MRNRYYDPATGQFTQQDPIGLAGGMNLYGFAGGDPVNYSDPFGLVCLDDDEICKGLVRTLRMREGDEFQEAADALETYKGGRVVLATPETHEALRGTYGGTILGKVTRKWDPARGEYVDGDIVLNIQQSSGEFLITAVHETYHLDLRGNLSNHEILPHERKALNQLPRRFRQNAGWYLDKLNY